jgi:acyl-homoserine-lactone acylase
MPVRWKSWAAMLDFGPPFKAMGVMSYGDSSQPGTKHHSDQLKYVASRSLRKLWFNRADVLKHVEEKTAF